MATVQVGAGVLRVTADVAPGPVLVGGLAVVVLVVAVGVLGVVLLLRRRKKK